jgi:hypothetical protein
LLSLVKEKDLIQRRDVLAQKLLQNLDKNHKFKNDKLLNFFEKRKKILKITGREEEPPYSIFHLKNLGSKILSTIYPNFFIF